MDSTSKRSYACLEPGLKVLGEEWASDLLAFFSHKTINIWVDLDRLGYMFLNVYQSNIEKLARSTVLVMDN